MEIEIKVPAVGESVQEAVLAQWYKADGDSVQNDEPLFVIETDKVTLEVNAEAEGILRIQVPEGETVAVGAVVGLIETQAAEGAKPQAETEKTEKKAQTPEKAEEAPEKGPEPEKEPPPEKQVPEAPPKAAQPKGEPEEKPAAEQAEQAPSEEQILPPSVRRLVAEKGIDVSKIQGTGPRGMVTKGDVIAHIEGSIGQTPPPEKEAPAPETPAPKTPAPKKEETAPKPAQPEGPSEKVERKPMSPIRKRIASRLLEARRNTAMLTTFNDVDMTRAMEIRSEYKEAFKKKHDVSLGFMSFFIKGCVAALQEFPAINAYIEGDEIVYHHYYHIGVAVGSDKGLVVPVIRHADKLSFAGVEKTIIEYVNKIRNNKLTLSDMEGGTFTITNGGVFGSLLSTPILNTPQSGILGMHRIEKRPVVVDDKIVIRPMMYLALSYDHRIVDGKDAVTFLVRIKECVENPERILLEM